MSAIYRATFHIGHDDLTMSTRRDFRRIRKAMVRGDEVAAADIAVARRIATDQVAYGRQSIVIWIVLLLACLASGIGLIAVEDRSLWGYVLLIVGVVEGLPPVWRYHRIRLWSDRHPAIAYHFTEAREPEQGSP